VNTIGIALIWCIVQITLLSVLAAGLYLSVRRLRPAAAAPVVFSTLAMVVVLSIFALSPWPRWTSDCVSPAPNVVASSPPALTIKPGLAGEERPQAKAYSRPLDSGERPAESVRAPSEETRPPVSNEQRAKAAETADAKLPVIASRPSSVSLLWETIMSELSNSPAANRHDVRRWPAVMAVVLLTAMACGIGWLLLGMAAVRRQRVSSQPILDAELLEMIDVLRAELNCLRPVEVRESADLVTAATIGWQRPVVLLPTDWRRWTLAQRQAVLAHEIYHARSQDFVALLFGQFGLMLHCYHPLLHWLMNRLRLEQELAADAAAASISGGSRQYLSTIAELALHTQHRRLSWPTRTFLPTQTTFLRRIAVLRDHEVRFDRVSPGARYAMIGAVSLFALLVAGLRGPSQLSQAAANDVATVAESAAAADVKPVAPTNANAKPNAPAAVKPAAAPEAKPSAPANTKPVVPADVKPVAPVDAKPSVAVDAKPVDVSPVAPAESLPSLRYGHKMGDSFYYTVKIAATYPDEDVSHNGALIYSVVSSTDEQFTLRCAGMLTPIHTRRADDFPGRMGPGFMVPSAMPRVPRIPFPPHHFGPGAEPMRPQESIFDRQGRVIQHGDTPSLPLLLGKQGELLIEQLPDAAKPAWSFERELGIVEQQESSEPFFSHLQPGTETHRGAKERIDYAVASQDSNSIRMSKKYSLKTAPERGVTHLDMSGNGELVFDKKLGIIRSEKMTYEVRRNEKNITVTIPMTFECRLMTNDELVQQKKSEAEAKKKSEEWLAKIKAEQAARQKGEAIPAPAPLMRTWREATGTYKVRASLVDVADGKVTLKKENGRTVTVPLEKLSKIDQDYAKRHAKSAKDKVPDPFE
jgi:beta-lactamase regulating signal transducer with metallopeptidase domain